MDEKNESKKPNKQTKQNTKPVHLSHHTGRVAAAGDKFIFTVSAKG
jgi:hypothetical protein